MNYIISVPLSSSLASFIGKKGSEDSLTFYNRKLDNDVIVALAPGANEDKFYHGMAESMLLSGQIVLSTETVDKLFGEALVAASLLDKPTSITNDNDISALLAGNVLKNYTVVSKDDLLVRIVANKPHEKEGETRIDIDHAFNVKGVGTVALGIVTSGKVKVHDSLFHTSGKQAMVRSIQSQDVDIQEAGIGTRVGLSLKGMEADEIGKGDILSSTKVAPAKSILVSIRQSALAGEQINDNNRYLFVSNFSYAIARVDKSGEGTKLVLEKPLSLFVGDRFFLIRDKSPRIFASGTIMAIG